MFSRSSTASLESLNESSSKKKTVFSQPYMHKQTILDKNNICYNNSEISSEDRSELNTRDRLLMVEP